MKKLKHLALGTKEYTEFENEVLKNLKWYDIPVTWTKKELREFYRQNQREYATVNPGRTYKP